MVPRGTVGVRYYSYVANNDSVAVIRAWWKLERARARFDAQVRRETGLTGSQLALLRIIDERAPVSIRQLRNELDWHPASLGQSIQRLVAHDMVTVTNDPADRRRRVCRLTGSGRALLARTPLVGPVRLRTTPIAADDLAAMRHGFNLALTAFGLDEWSDDE